MTGAAEIRVESSNAACAALLRPYLSVVIPTFRRADTLARVLSGLSSQDAAVLAQTEVVVCDDGSGDGTVDMIREAAARLPYAFSWVSLARNGGPARARNAALRRARGAIVLLLGDDIVPAPAFLLRHATWHRQHPEAGAALLGFTTWPSELAGDPFLKWLEDGGRRYFFNYRDLSEQEPVSAMHFYTCNVSFKRALLETAGLFDESFPFASHEDLELGLRLARAGMRLHFDRRALAFHWHRLDFSGTMERVYRMGHSSELFWQKTGGGNPAWKRALRPLLASLCSLTVTRRLVRRGRDRILTGGKPAPARWLRLLDLAYWCGVADARCGRVDARLEGP